MKCNINQISSDRLQKGHLQNFHLGSEIGAFKHMKPPQKEIFGIPYQFLYVMQKIRGKDRQIYSWVSSQRPLLVGAAICTFVMV